MTPEELAAIRKRYGSGTSGPNWQAANYKDGPGKDRLLDEAKEHVRALLAEVDRLNDLNVALMLNLRDALDGTEQQGTDQ